jgi:hypothetical protein
MRRNYEYIKHISLSIAVVCLSLHITDWLYVVVLHPFKEVIPLLSLLPPCASGLIFHHWRTASSLRSSNNQIAEILISVVASS